MARKLLCALLAVSMLLLFLPAFAEEAEEDAPRGFRTFPGVTCLPLSADGTVEYPGRFQIDVPAGWDYMMDGSDAFGVPGVLAAPDEAHSVIVTEIPAAAHASILADPRNRLNGFLQEGLSVVRGESTDESRILEVTDLHGLRATRVEMVGQGFEMIWIEDGADLWFFMYPADPADADYTAAVADIVDSFTVYHPASIGDAPEEDFEYAGAEDGVTLTRYTGQAAYVHVPAELGGRPVTGVADRAFYETDVREVTLPDTVAELGTFVFGGCVDLTTVTLPANLRVLPAGTFESCFRLTNAELNEGLTTIESTAFWANFYLSELTLPDSLAEIGENSFTATPILTYFNVGEGCAGFAANDEGTILFTKDGRRLLRYGAVNTDWTYAVPDGVETIDPYAFSYQPWLEKVTFPESLRSVGGMAFAMTDIEEFTIPAGVTELGVLRGVRVEGGDETVAFTVIGNETVIRGTPGTAAETYAQKNNRTFIPVEAESPAGSAP